MPKVLSPLSRLDIVEACTSRLKRRGTALSRRYCAHLSTPDTKVPPPPLCHPWAVHMYQKLVRIVAITYGDSERMVPPFIVPLACKVALEPKESRTADEGYVTKGEFPDSA